VTTEFWTAYWWWWLVAVFATFFVMEIAAVALAWRTHQRQYVVWTLSDTIRRWASAYRWLALVVIVAAAFLLWHFFVQQNPA
jgi:hypothetical protein